MPLAYRLALIVGAALLVAALPWGEFGSLIQEPLLSGSGQPPLAVLVLVACATALLTLNYPGRSGVSILLLVVAAAWWHLGTLAAALVGAAGALAGSARLGRSLLVPLSAVARLVIAASIGATVAAPLVAAPLPAPFTANSLAVGAFILVASAIDAGLDWLDGRLHSLHTQQDGADSAAHTDLLTNLFLAPLAVFLQVVDAQLGFDRLTVVLAGVLALLLVVRSSVNQRTLRRVVEEEREKLATLFAHSGEGIFTVDANLRIATLNPAMELLLGRPAATVQGLPCAQAFGFQDADGQPICPDRCPLRQAQAEQRPVTQEIVYQLPEQPPKHLLLTYAAVGDPGEPLRLGIGIARDISALKEAERLREEFVSLVTHELRSPMTVTTAYASMLRESLEQNAPGRPFDPIKALRYVKGIQGAGHHLLRLINNLLDIARVEQAELPVEYEELPLADLVNESVDAMAAVAQEKGVTFRVNLLPGRPLVRTSTVYVREVLGNLLSNAVKYTPAGGQVTVSASLHPAGDGGSGSASAATAGPSWEVAVTDTGYGISPEDQERLFTKFFRSGRHEIRQQRGTGLGLALTRQMVERLGGTIAVRSQLGAGSTFTVTFPIVPADEPTGSVAAGSVATGSGSADYIESSTVLSTVP